MDRTLYLSLGANLGNRRNNLLAAIDRLGALGRFVGQSGFYETEPVEVAQEQPWFWNCAVALDTALDAGEILRRTMALEQDFGRRRGAAKMPRPIDIDILLYGDVVLSQPGLTIPHPALHRRRFVLVPLVEIAPGVRHPLLLRTMKELLDALPRSVGVVRKLSA